MKNFILTICLVFATTFAISQNRGPSSRNYNPNAPVITFEKVIHDYGTIDYKSTNKNVCTFKFKNTGREPLILSRPKSSCGCAIPSWPKQPIMPGQSGEIKVKFDTKRVGKIKKTVTIKSNARNKSVVLKLKGSVKPRPKKK